MKKRILSIVMAVLMLVSVLPVPVLAATTDTPETDVKTSVSAGNDAVQIKKSVVTGEDGNLSLKLEAYATNTMSTVTSSEPLDIVLVLDVSGSMAYGMTSYTYVGTQKTNWSCSDIERSYDEYYYKDTDDNYYEVEVNWNWSNRDNYTCCLTANGKTIGNVLNNGWNNTACTGTLYTLQESRDSRLSALKTAVNKFIDSVADQKDSENKPIGHKISVVKFASDESEEVGNKKDKNGYNYSQIVMNLTDASTGKTALQEAVNALSADGATRSDYGMKRAKKVLDDRGTTTRKSVVILFTDGTPTSYSSWDPEVAEAAINTAKDLKTAGTKIYTVGIFDGANPNADVNWWKTSNENKYMQAMSSNYPAATFTYREAYWDGLDYHPATETFAFGTPAEGNYYLAASSAEGLNGVFQTISREVGSLTATVDKSSVLSDTLSKWFDFAPVEGEGAGNITVEVVPVNENADADGNYTWGTPKAAGTGVKAEIDSENHKKLNVTGFDYAKNAVTEKTDGTYTGSKLVVTIPIKPDVNATGWQDGDHYYDTNSITNGSKAGLTFGEEGNEQTVELSKSPKAPVTGYTVSYAFKEGEKPENVKLPDVEVYIEDQKYTIEDGYTVDGWTFTGWCSDEACTTIVSGQKTMGIEDVTYYGKWTKDEEPVQTVTLSFEFKSGTPDKPNLPSNMPTAPDPVTDEVGKNVTLKTDYTEVDDSNGKWTFGGWYEDEGLMQAVTGTSYQIPEGGKTLYGKWTFEAAGEPEDTIDITVEKVWTKYEWQDVEWGTSAEVTLYKDGAVCDTAPLTEANNWEYTFTGLDKYRADGRTEIEYTLRETKVDGNTTFEAKNSKGEVVGKWVPEVKTSTTEGIDYDILNTFMSNETPEPEEHEFTAHIVKRFENKSGKSPKATFTFVAELEDGTEVGSAEIDFSKGDVDAGDIGRDDVTMTVTLTDSQYKELDRDEIGPYLWIYEEDGDVDGVKYDGTKWKAYILEATPYSLELDEDGALTLSETDPTALWCMLDGTYSDDFVFTNTYKKPGEKGETIKSGPQLNRDDHVAYIMGYPDGTVQPEGEITRAEACTIFFRLLTDSSRDYYFSKTNDYSDVNAGDWFNNAISTLSNAGIVTGYNDGTFRPNQPITRGEMAKIIANFANLKSGDKTFTDLAGHWSKTYVELAAGNGWIAGYPDGSFRPDQKITRAETVTMINRVLERVPAKESRLLSRSIMLTFPDNNPGDWYYIAIQEASNSHEYQRSVYEAAGDEMWTKLIENVDWTKLEK